MKSNLDHARVLVEKAENDLKTVEIGLEHGAPLDTVSFHLQQTAEKLIKSLLVSRDISYPRTHDLDDLLDLLPLDCSSVFLLRERIIGWTSYAVDMRYEIGSYPDKKDLFESLATARELYSAVQSHISRADR